MLGSENGGHGCDSIWFGIIVMHMLILKMVIHGRLKDTPMHNMVGNFSQNLKSHGISNIGSNTNPPSGFLFSGREGLVRIEVENLFIKLLFQKS